MLRFRIADVDHGRRRPCAALRRSELFAFQPTRQGAQNETASKWDRYSPMLALACVVYNSLPPIYCLFRMLSAPRSNGSEGKIRHHGVIEKSRRVISAR